MEGWMDAIEINENLEYSQYLARVRGHFELVPSSDCSLHHNSRFGLHLPLPQFHYCLSAEWMDRSVDETRLASTTFCSALSYLTQSLSLTRVPSPSPLHCPPQL